MSYLKIATSRSWCSRWTPEKTSTAQPPTTHHGPGKSARNSCASVRSKGSHGPYSRSNSASSTMALQQDEVVVVHDLVLDATHLVRASVPRLPFTRGACLTPPRSINLARFSPD